MPELTTSKMFFIYVLSSAKDQHHYIGYTDNLKRRLEEHNKGLNQSTKPRIPLKLIYLEGCLNQIDVKRRERYLKTTQGRRFLGLRLKEYQHALAFGIRG